MNSRNQWVIFSVLASVLLSLMGCASVSLKHPQVMQGEITPDLKSQLAAVYFIRPQVFKTKGVANEPVRIEFQGQTLLKQPEGNYTLLYIKPSKGMVKVHSKTPFTDKRLPVEVWREREYKFIAGKTYFVYVRQINEEFRGIFYEPEPVSLKEAKELIVPGKGRFGSALATGAARSAPIDKLTEVDDPPASAVKSLAPALPEDIYKQEKYLHKVR